MSTLTDQALDCQLGLIRWHELAYAPRYYETMLQLNEDLVGVRAWNADTLTSALHRLLNIAETFAVTAEMGELLEAGAATLPIFPLQEVDIPCRRGFCYLERAITFYDINHKALVLNGFTWATSHVMERSEALHLDELKRAQMRGTPATGVWITLFTDPRDERDMNFIDFRDLPYEVTGPLIYINDFPWLFGQSWHDMTGIIAKEEGKDHPGAVDTEALDSTSSLLRVIAAFFRIVMEPFVDTTAIAPSRHVRRRRERLAPNIPEEGVHVITLRKSREGYVSPASLERDEPYYSHRFLVRPHWRNQWYPSEQRHAPRYIEGYVKGPEGTPLVLHDHVYEWRR